MSLDGVVQAPGGATEDTDGGFAHGGWTIPYWHDDIGERFSLVMKDADTLLLGRKTWQIHSVFEKMDNDPFGKAMNAIAKFVVSRTLTSTEAWRNSTLIKDNVIEEVKKLKMQPGQNILMDGSSVLLKTLIENDLVDELQLHIYPLSLGGGKRIFPEGKRVNLKLLESKSLPTGVVFNHYSVIK